MTRIAQASVGPHRVTTPTTIALVAAAEAVALGLVHLLVADPSALHLHQQRADDATIDTTVALHPATLRVTLLPTLDFTATTAHIIAALHHLPIIPIAVILTIIAVAAAAPTPARLCCPRAAAAAAMATTAATRALPA
jgi:hypothetical protein